ncbi:DUF6463 family protein [Streptomyces sp. NPDC059193]|uniref:DUF6463 family protein n=1 Tax=Streptomyces sp. NPDC059193 TaxID=3346763 RepID=UPI0036AA5C05
MHSKRVKRLFQWSGGIIAVIGGGHLAGALVSSASHFGDWLTLGLWGSYLEDSDSANDFWGSVGGFGWPLFTVGLVVLWMNRNGIIPPKFLAWTVMGWGAFMTYIVEPTPGPAVVIAGLLMLRGIHIANKAEEAKAPAGSFGSRERVAGR